MEEVQFQDEPGQFLRIDRVTPVIYYLNEMDDAMMAYNYMEMGLLFRYDPMLPTPDTQNLRRTIQNSLIEASRAFLILAGRLKMVMRVTEVSFLVDMGNLRGNTVWFQIGRSTLNVEQLDTYNQLLQHDHIDPLFPKINGRQEPLIGLDGYDLPVLGAKLTFLEGGFFLGVTMSHMLADGTSFWFFIKAWAEACSRTEPTVRKFFERYFIRERPPPVWIRYAHYHTIAARYPNHLPPPRQPDWQEGFFHMPAASIANIKAQANVNRPPDEHVSSLLSTIAYLWKRLVQALKLHPRASSWFHIPANLREETFAGINTYYFGNSHCTVTVKMLAQRVRKSRLDDLAEVIYREIETQRTAEVVKDWIAGFNEQNELSFGRLQKGHFIVANTHRADIFGIDFGWGAPVNVRSGRGNKMPGYLTLYPGREAGSLSFEICLLTDDMDRLLQDPNFLAIIGDPAEPQMLPE